MMHWKATGALVCWLVGLPLHLWAIAGGPVLAYAGGVAGLVIGIVLFTAWAAAGGMPRMYVR